jgi:hypothetical protein
LICGDNLEEHDTANGVATAAANALKCAKDNAVQNICLLDTNSGKENQKCPFFGDKSIQLLDSLCGSTSSRKHCEEEDAEHEYRLTA